MMVATATDNNTWWKILPLWICWSAT